MKIVKKYVYIYIVFITRGLYAHRSSKILIETVIE